MAGVGGLGGGGGGERDKQRKKEETRGTMIYNGESIALDRQKCG